MNPLAHKSFDTFVLFRNTINVSYAELGWTFFITGETAMGKAIDHLKSVVGVADATIRHLGNMGWIV